MNTKKTNKTTKAQLISADQITDIVGDIPFSVRQGIVTVGTGDGSKVLDIIAVARQAIAATLEEIVLDYHEFNSTTSGSVESDGARKYKFDHTNQLYFVSPDGFPIFNETVETNITTLEAKLNMTLLYVVSGPGLNFYFRKEDGDVVHFEIPVTELLDF